jgi:hypothetical protein
MYREMHLSNTIVYYTEDNYLLYPSAIPTMYNLIEDSQDTTQFSESIDPDQLSKNTQKPTPQPSCKDCTPHSDNSTLKQLPDDIIEETTPNSSEVNLLTVVPDSEMDTHNGIVAGYEETGTSGLAVSVCNKSHQISDGGIDGQLNGDCLELDDEIGVSGVCLLVCQLL